MFLDPGQLIDLQVSQFHLLLRVDHLHLQLRERLWRQEVRETPEERERDE